MNIEDLRKSVSLMSDEELSTLLLDIRRIRRTPPARVSSTLGKKSTAEPSVDALLSALSPEQRDRLLQALMEKKDGA